MHHIVLLTFRDDLGAADKQAVIDAVVALKADIPQIQSVDTGINSNNTTEAGLARGHSHAFVMVFASEADRDAYLLHPKHVEVAQRVVVPALADGGIVVFDMKVV